MSGILVIQDRKLRIAGEMSLLAKRHGTGCTNEMVLLISQVGEEKLSGELGALMGRG